MSPEGKEAFLNAYEHRIGIYSREAISIFLDEYYDDCNKHLLYDKYRALYTSIVDYLSIWHDAQKFAILSLKK